jgi:hypothetical protein
MIVVGVENVITNTKESIEKSCLHRDNVSSVNAVNCRVCRKNIGYTRNWGFATSGIMFCKHCAIEIEGSEEI